MGQSVWLIAGPTASGKSALALRLAEATGGEIVNADALQLYRDLAVLSARPSPAETAQAPHHLYGMVDAAEGWSVGRWQRAAAAVLAEIKARGRTAIVVGGTGLYFRALTHGLAEIPEIPAEARAAVAALWAEGGETAVRGALHAGDPVSAARIMPGDRQRLLRALEVWQATGQPLGAWQADTTPLLPPGSWRGVVMEPDRASLYARCDARLEAMAAGGALEEAAALMARNLDPALPAMKAVGFPELARHLRGDLSLHEAIAEAQQATRNYAKRQLTWFRNQTPDWPRVTALEADAAWDQLSSGAA
jgi:tRNA dimethylallyltransferase